MKPFIIFIILNFQIPGKGYIHNYFRYINKAEMYIVEGKYIFAVKEYETAFKNNERKFAKDIYNSLVCLIKINDRANATKMLIELSKIGVDFNFIKSNIDIARFFGKKLRHTYFLKYKKFKCNEHCKKINELFLIDQKIRLKNTYKPYFYPELINDYQIAKELINLISEFNFPNEDVLGFSNGVNVRSNFGVIIIHQNLQNKSFNFGEILHKAVNDGFLTPNLAMMLYSSQFTSDPLGFYFGTGFSPNSKNSTLYSIDEEREIWGVDKQYNYFLKQIT